MTAPHEGVVYVCCFCGAPIARVKGAAWYLTLRERPVARRGRTSSRTAACLRAQVHPAVPLLSGKWCRRGARMTEAPRSVIRVADLTIDLGARTVRRASADLALRPKEFDLLAALVRSRGRVVSRADLLREVWGYAADARSRTVETHLAALRQRLGDDPRAPRYIATIRSAGYRLGG